MGPSDRSARRHALLLSVAITLLGCAAYRASAQAERVGRTDPESSPPADYVPGEVIVKVSPEAAQAIEQATAAEVPLVTSIESLDRLLAQYGVTAIEPVFSHAQDPESIKAKYPERSKRIPPGAEVPDLSRTYLVHFSADVDAMEAASALSQDPHVEYAQPNYLATIQAQPEGRP